VITSRERLASFVVLSIFVVNGEAELDDEKTDEEDEDEEADKEEEEDPPETNEAEGVEIERGR